MHIQTIGSGSSGNCYLIKGSATSLLLEAGISYKKMQKAVKFKTSQIKGVLVTHEHLDHAKHVREYMNNGLDVYMTQGTRDALKLDNNYRLKIIKERNAFKVDDFKILPFEAVHDAAEPVGFVIANGDNKLLYATDTKYIKYQIPGLTHIMLEANHEYEYMMQNVQDGVIHQSLANRIMDSHMSLETAIKYLSKIDTSKLKEVMLIHLSDTNSRRNYFKEKIQGATGVLVTVAKGE